MFLAAIWSSLRSWSFFNSKFKPETDWIFAKTYVRNTRIQLNFSLHVDCWTHGNLPTPWGIIPPHQIKLLDSFVVFAAFRPMVFHFAQVKQKWKKLQTSGQAHFLSASSPDSSPPDRLALCRSHVCCQMWACSQAMPWVSESPYSAFVFFNKYSGIHVNQPSYIL